MIFAGLTQLVVAKQCCREYALKGGLRKNLAVRVICILTLKGVTGVYFGFHFSLIYIKGIYETITFPLEWKKGRFVYIKR